MPEGPNEIFEIALTHTIDSYNLRSQLVINTLCVGNQLTIKNLFQEPTGDK